MTRAEAERVRIRHAVDRFYGTLSSIKVALSLPGPIGAEASNGLMMNATELAMQIAKHDAFLLAEADAQVKP